MKVAIGTTVIAAGTAGGEPARLAGGTATKSVEIVPRIGAAAAGVYSRGNRYYIDIIEAEYSYATFALAQAAVHSLRSGALAATGSLIYGAGEAAVTVGPAECRTAELVDWSGCGITMRYEIVAQETES